MENINGKVNKPIQCIHFIRQKQRVLIHHTISFTFIFKYLTNTGQWPSGIHGYSHTHKGAGSSRGNYRPLRRINSVDLVAY